MAKNVQIQNLLFQTILVSVIDADGNLSSLSLGSRETVIVGEDTVSDFTKGLATAGHIKIEATE